MKKVLPVLSLATLLFLAACGDSEENANAANNNNNQNVNNVENEENEENNDIGNNVDDNEEDNNENNANEGNENEESADTSADGEWETQVGETVENDAGTFTLHARQDQIDTIETGPIVIEIEQLNAQSGELSPDFAELMETEELQMIQLDITVENTADEDITFYAGQATIATSTGEQIVSDMWLSDYIDGDLMSGTTHSGTFFFVLENSNAEDVEDIRITWSAPFDEDWEDVGEDVDITIEF